MANDGRQLNIYYNENGEIDVVRVVAPTVIKTVYHLLVCGSLIIVLIFGMFPLTAMGFFERMGLNNRALDMVNLYVERESKRDTSVFSNYTDGLYYKMVLSEELYLQSNGKKSEKYLKNIYDSTYRYSIVPDIEERNSRIDDNNLLSFPPMVHTSVFSFKDRVCNLNYFAAIRLNKCDEFLIGYRKLGLDSILSDISGINGVTLKASLYGNDRISEQAAYFSIFFGQLTEYIKYNLHNNTGDTQNTLTLLTDDNYRLMNILEEKLVVFKEFALSYYDSFDDFETVAEIDVRLGQLYLVRCVGRLYNSLYNAAEFLGVKEERWDALRKVDIDGEDSTVMDYFVGKLLPDYMEFHDSIHEQNNIAE